MSQKLGFWGSHIINTSNNCMNQLNSVGFYFTNSKVNYKNDDLLNFFDKFYKDNHKIAFLKSNNLYVSLMFPNPTFIRYCADTQFRELFDNDKLTELLSLYSNKPSYPFFNL